MGFNKGGPGERVCVRHFVEQLGCIVETATSAVQLEKTVGGGDGGM